MRHLHIQIAGSDKSADRTKLLMGFQHCLEMDTQHFFYSLVCYNSFRLTICELPKLQYDSKIITCLSQSTSLVCLKGIRSS